MENIIQSTLLNQLHNSPSFYVIKVNMEGRYTYVNRTFEDKFKFIAPNLLGLPFEITLHPEDREACQAVTLACIANPEDSFPIQLRKPAPDGQYILCFYEFSAVRNQAGDVTEIMCIGYDITHTAKAYADARQASEKFENIIENITDAFYILDRQWRYIKVNRVLEEISGHSREYFLGKVIWDVYPSRNGVENLKKIYTQALETNTSMRLEEFIPEMQVWIERTIYPSQEGLTVLFRDITSQKQTEEYIREANNKLIAALNSTSDLNILISPQYNILSFNKVATEFARTFFNRPLTEGDSLWLMILPGTESMFTECIQKALAGHSIERKYQFKFAPGIELWYRLKFYPVSDAAGQLIGVTLNATNIDKEQRQLENLEEIATLYSNQVRRPVATIMGITRLINEDDLNINNKEWFGYLIKTTQELDRVVNRILKKSDEIG